MFVTNWISTTKIQKISEITNFFRHYFLSRTEVLLEQQYRCGVEYFRSHSVYCIVHQLVELVIMTGLLLRVKLLYLLVVELCPFLCPSEELFIYWFQDRWSVHPNRCQEMRSPMPYCRILRHTVSWCGVAPRFPEGVCRFFPGWRSALVDYCSVLSFNTALN